MQRPSSYFKPAIQVEYPKVKEGRSSGDLAGCKEEGAPVHPLPPAY